MRLSVNEFRTACRRAAVGAGIPFGLAEEAADAAAWLATAGLEGVQVFCRALQGILEGRSVAVALRSDQGRSRLTPVKPGCTASVLFAGPALSDRILAHGSGSGAGGLSVCSVDEPLLLLAGTVNAGRRFPAGLTIVWHRGNGRPVKAQCRDGACTLWGRDLLDASAPGPVDVDVGFGAQGEAGDMRCLLGFAAAGDERHRCYRHGITLADHEHEWLNHHARRMLVADSRQSRLSGAGAGLHDND